MMLSAAVLLFIGGFLLGIIFFGGLWVTLRTYLYHSHVAVWLLLSWLIRTTVVLLGFYWLASDNWQRWLICIVGFCFARQLTIKKIKNISYAFKS